MRKLVITTTLHILPPLAGEMEEQHEAKGGYIYLPPIPSFHSGTSSLNGGRILFSNAKSLLGQEFPYAVYDMRAENGVNFNLEALAIVTGTIQENGTLYLLCPNWETLEQEIDFDSLRWNDGTAIATPNFWAYFKALVNKYGFYITPLFELRGAGEILQNKLTEKSLSHFGYTDCQISPNPSLLKRGTVLTEDQIHIFNNLPHSFESIHLITAPRGRGKSTLAGLLAEKIAQEQPVIITSRAKVALPNFWKQIENQQNINFFAPDRLIQAVENREISAKSWLFIDEAASLPLPILHTLCAYFEKVVLTTTTQNYEGTGRGFELKFPVILNKPFKHWTLSQPLRWSGNDPLEHFINDLLLLNGDTVGANCNSPLQSADVANKRIHHKIEFYHLLANAHYKTTPTDLRRLFDGENQLLFPQRENGQLIGGIWVMQEGGLDEKLTQAIWLGERRPQGSLVAQYLCFQGNLPQACQLHSIRISRIAVLPEKQNQGIGKRLISQFILQNAVEKRPLDFISVSFGLTTPLRAFWQSCGFQLVQITPNKEASSGYQSAMMIYPISEQGKLFAQQASQAFARDFALQPFFTEICEELQNFEQFRPLATHNLDERDWKNLTAFAHGKRTFSAAYVSLKRLYLSDKARFSELDIFERKGQKISKMEVENYRKLVLQNLNNKSLK